MLSRKLFVLLCLLSLTAPSCTKDELSQLPPPLQSVVASFEGDCNCQPYINLYHWKGQKIYVLMYAGPACNWTPSYYVETGHPLDPRPPDPQQFFAEARLIKQVWSCSE